LLYELSIIPFVIHRFISIKYFIGQNFCLSFIKGFFPISPFILILPDKLNDVVLCFRDITIYAVNLSWIKNNIMFPANLAYLFVIHVVHLSRRI